MENKKRKLPLIYIIGMPIILVLANAVAYLKFGIVKGANIYISVFLYPLTFLISGLIIKKTNYKDALQIMAVSLISASLASVIEWALLNIAQPWVMIYSFLSFLICQLIFIYVYDFLIKTKKDTYFIVFLLLALVLGIDHAFFGTIIERQIISESILIRLAYCVIFPLFLAKKTAKKVV